MCLASRKARSRNLNAPGIHYISVSYSYSLRVDLLSQAACSQEAGIMAAGCFGLTSKQTRDYGVKGSSLAAPVKKTAGEVF